jgi:hypothetical protein
MAQRTNNEVLARLVTDYPDHPPYVSELLRDAHGDPAVFYPDKVAVGGEVLDRE